MTSPPSSCCLTSQANNFALWLVELHMWWSWNPPSSCGWKVYCRYKSRKIIEIMFDLFDNLNKMSFDPPGFNPSFEHHCNRWIDTDRLVAFSLCFWFHYSVISQSDDRHRHESHDNKQLLARFMLIYGSHRNILVIAYYVLTLNTANLHGDAYTNCFLSAVVEIPAYILSWIMFRWCSRRLSLFSTFFTGGLFLLLIHLIPASRTLDIFFMWDHRIVNSDIISSP